MKKHFIGFMAILVILAFSGFHLSKWSYEQGLQQSRYEQTIALEDEYASGLSAGKNDTWKLCNDKFTEALQTRGMQCENSQKPVESNVVKLCTPIEDYENMILDRDEEIMRLNSLLLANMYK